MPKKVNPKIFITTIILVILTAVLSVGAVYTLFKAIRTFYELKYSLNLANESASLKNTAYHDAISGCLMLASACCFLTVIHALHTDSKN